MSGHATPKPLKHAVKDGTEIRCEPHNAFQALSLKELDMLCLELLNSTPTGW